MDFFQSQAEAHKRTRKLIVLFALAVAATITTLYLVAVLVAAQIPLASRQDRHGTYYEFHEPDSYLPRQWWEPKLFAYVAGGTLLAIASAALYKSFQLRHGGPDIAEMMGGRQIDTTTTDHREKRLLNVVEEMAIASGVPVPVVYVLDEEPAINAFAAGLTTNDAVVAVTRGTLEKLNRDELQGVIAHEFSHILNGDMRLNLRLVSVVFGIFFLTIIGRGLIRSLRHTGNNRNKKDARIVFILLAIGVILIVVGTTGYFFGRLIQAAVSRQREFLADASSVQFTRNPGGIVGALKKIGGHAMGGRMQHPRAAAISHFFFAEALRSGLTGMLATHPPLEKRLLAIDPSFDGRFEATPETIDIAKESFLSTGIGTTPRHTRPAQAAPVPNVLTPALAIASIGTISSENISNAQGLLDRIPERLRQAARSPADAPALIYGLLLDANPAARQRQLALLPAAKSTAIFELSEALAHIECGQKIPLCQLAQPALRELDDEAMTDFFATLELLVKADTQVTTFEYALQKVLQHQVLMAKVPKLSFGSQVFSYQAMREPLAILLSAIAQATADSPGQAAKAFLSGIKLLRNIEPVPQLLPPDSCGPTQLDSALDTLARAAAPIRQRAIEACAHAAGADGQIRIAELELLRAFSACLDCPLPPLSDAMAAA